MRHTGLTCLLLLGTAHAVAGAETNSLPALEGLVREWTRLRVEIAEEERGWAEKETQWRAEIDLLGRETAALTKEIDHASQIGASLQQERLEGLREKERLAGMLDALPPLLDRAETALRAWPDRLPPPLREPLDPAFQRLPKDRAEADRMSTGARLQLIVALYSEIEKLQHDFHPVKEILALPDGSRKEMDVLYLGLARAFAVSRDGAWAAIGAPVAHGWTWEVRPRIADNVRRAIDVCRREHTAEIVALPLAVTEGAK